MTLLRDIHAINDDVATVLGLLCNFFLFLVVVTSRNSELKKYNQVILQTTFIDACLNIIHVVAKPVGCLNFEK